MDHGLIWHWADVCIFDLDVKAFLLGEIVEFVVDEMSVVDILLKTDDGESLECLWLVDHLVEAVGVLKGASAGVVRVLAHALATSTSLELIVVSVTLGLLCKVWSFENHGLFQYLGLNGVWVQLDVKTPLFDLRGLRDHFI